MGRTTPWQAIISPWAMGRTAPYDPWVMENLFPMGHGSYDALEIYKFPMGHGSYDFLASYNFPMGHGSYDTVASYNFPMGHGSYDSLASYNFPMGHGSYGTVRSMGHGEFISHGAWIVRCFGKL